MMDTIDIPAQRPVLDDDALDLIFRQARTHSAWQQKPVTEELLHEIYEIARWGPTSANTSPLRILFIRTPEAKERLLPAVAEMNVEKTRTAPVTAIFAYDTEFYEYLPKLVPYRDLRSVFADAPELSRQTAYQNATLQAAYIIVAARGLGLDCGPMAGFDADKVNAEFFPDGKWRATFLCNLGYGDSGQLWPRMPRLEFEEACVVM